MLSTPDGFTVGDLCANGFVSPRGNNSQRCLINRHLFNTVGNFSPDCLLYPSATQATESFV
jgi:hypothetical protein